MVNRVTNDILAEISGDMTIQTINVKLLAKDLKNVRTAVMDIRPVSV